jgi:hypothetical protein
VPQHQSAAERISTGPAPARQLFGVITGHFLALPPEAVSAKRAQPQSDGSRDGNGLARFSYVRQAKH